MAANSPIYLDNAATTRPLDTVVEAMGRAHIDSFGNPSSTHLFAEAPKQALEDARAFLRGSLGAAGLIFTSGGTEADLLGVLGAVQERAPGRVLVGAADHPAVLAQAARLERTHHKIAEVAVDAGGTMEPEALFDCLGRDVRCVAILHGHNELGGLARLEDLVSLCRRVAPDAHLHVDLVQAYGKVPFDLDEAGVDSVAVSAHKLHGPRGTGFLAYSSTARLSAIQAGGGQEAGIRGGTENVAGAAGLAVAAEHALSHLADHAAHMLHLLEVLEDHIQTEFPRATRLGVPGRRLPHVLSMRIPGLVGETLQQRASAHGVAFSTGSACHAAEQRDNHVLRAVGLSRRAAREVVRLSVSPQNSETEVRAAAAQICGEAKQMAEIGRGL